MAWYYFRVKSSGQDIMRLNQQVIRETKTWILRCYACFRTTPRMEKKFCPKCGNKTLKRVSVTVDSEGKQQVFKMLLHNLFSSTLIFFSSNTKNLAGPHQHKATVDIKGQAFLPAGTKSIYCPSNCSSADLKLC